MVIVNDLSRVQPCLLIRYLLIKKNQNTNENASPKPQVEWHNYLENRIALVTLRPISCKKGFIYTNLLHRAFPSALLVPSVFFFFRKYWEYRAGSLLQTSWSSTGAPGVNVSVQLWHNLFLLCSNNHNVFLPTGWLSKIYPTRITFTKPISAI